MHEWMNASSNTSRKKATLKSELLQVAHNFKRVFDNTDSFFVQTIAVFVS